VRLICIAALLLAGSARAWAQEQVVTLEPRPGVTLRILIEAPAKPIGSVILLAGGHGNLDLSERGRMGWGAGNQLVRTRSDYARAGYITVTPDIASDFKRPGGATDAYRWSAAHAADIGHIVQYLRTLAEPVYLVGTSRGALSAGNAAVRLEGSTRPDALVITSGMLMARVGHQPSVQRNVGRLERITIPVLLVHHEYDACTTTPAADAERFAKLLTAAPVDIRILRGGFTRGDPCEAQSYHGFLGIDDEVVSDISGWLGALPRKN